MDPTRPPLRVAMLAGGEPGSIMDVRANGLAAYAAKSIDAAVLAHQPGRPHLVDAARITQRIRALQPAVIYILNTGTIGLPAAVLRLLGGAPFIVDTGDLSFRLVTVMGEATLPKRWWIGATEHFLLDRASAIVVRGSYHRQLLSSKFSKPIYHIPDGVETDKRAAPEVGDDRIRLGLHGKITVGLVGHLGWSPRHQWGYGRDLVDLLVAAPDLPLHGILIGDGPGREPLQQLARRAGVADRLTFVGYIPYAELPRWLALIDIALLTMIDDESWEVRTTGKLPEYLAAGRYILSTQVGEAKRFLPPAQILEYRGIYDPSYGRALAGKLREIRGQLPSLVAAARRTGPIIARNHFDYQHLAAEWSSVIFDVARRDS